MLYEELGSPADAHAVIAGLPLGIAIWNKNYDLVAYNDVILDVIGLNIEDDVQRKEDFLRASLDLNYCGTHAGLAHEEVLSDLMRDGNVTTVWQHCRPDGMLVNTKVTIAFMLYQGQKAHVAYFQALSFQQTLAPSTREFSEHFKALYASNVLGLSVWDNTFSFIDCNKRLLSMLEVSSKEDLVQGFHRFSPPLQPCGSSSYTLAFDNNKKVYEEGVASFEWLHTTNTGKDLYIKVHSERVIYQEKPVALCIVQDYTMERVLNRELASLTERLHSMLGYIPNEGLYWNVAQADDANGCMPQEAHHSVIHVPQAPHMKLNYMSQRS